MWNTGAMSRVTQVVVELIFGSPKSLQIFPHHAQKSLEIFYISPVLSQVLYL
jgi:hypothetical protein